jgi:hypothetical protein
MKILCSIVIISCFALCPFVTSVAADEKEKAKIEQLEARLNRGELLAHEELNQMDKHIRNTTEQAFLGIPKNAKPEQRAGILKSIENARREMAAKVSKAREQLEDNELLTPAPPQDASPRDRDWISNYAPKYNKRLLEIIKSDLSDAEKHKALEKVHAEAEKHYQQFSRAN